MDMLRNRVRHRFKADLERSAAAIDTKLKAIAVKRANDSCSDSDGEDGEWKQYEDNDGSIFYFSAARNEQLS